MELAIIILLVLIASVLFTVFIFVYGSKNNKEEEVFEDLRNPCVMQILVPRENDKSALAAEQMLASIHGILEGHKKCLDVVSLEIVSSEEHGIKFYIVSPQHIAKFVEGQIYAQYPNADIRYTQDYTVDTARSTDYITAGEVEMEKDSIFPIKTFRNFKVDPPADRKSHV